MNRKTLNSPQPVHPSPVGRLLAVVGAVCLFGPFAAFLFTAFTMIRHFAEAAGGDSGTGSAGLHQSVGATLTVTMIALNLGLLGAALTCVAIFVFGFAPPWLREVLKLGALFLLPFVPIGTVFAFVLYLAVCRNPRVFARPTLAEPGV